MGRIDAALVDNMSLLLTVPEAAKLLRCSRNKAYELVKEGRLPSLHIGRKVLIHRAGLEVWLAREAGVPDPVSPMVRSPAQPH